MTDMVSAGDDLIRDAVELAGKVYDEGLQARPGEGLREHNLATALIEVTVLPESFINHLFRAEGVTSEAVKSILMLSGILHDWGKALLPYQRHLREGGVHPPLRHEVTSFIAFASLLKPSLDPARALYTALGGAILYHHHGLYDFTDKLIKYLRGRVRAWPTLSDTEAKEDLLSKLSVLYNALKQYLRETELNKVLRVRPASIVNDLTDESRFKKVLQDVILLEEGINERRNLVTPALSALMVGDNLSAASSLYGSNEAVQEVSRISLMSEATIATVLAHIRKLEDTLNLAGLPKYARAIHELMIRYSGGSHA